jgi:hypothetical protein
MTKKIIEITEVTLDILKKNPPILAITCKGNVSSGGWSNGKLIAYTYKKPPPDGIYDFDFVADEPTGTNTQVISEVTSQTFMWENFPPDLVGVKVHSSENYITARLKEERGEKLMSEDPFPFHKVTPSILEELKRKNDMFFISNAFVWEDVLTVSVQYSGGCKKHDFQLVWDGTYTKSLPPQISLFLIHNNNGDTCKAIVREELQFVLSSELTIATELLLDGWAKKLKFSA